LGIFGDKFDVYSMLLDFAFASGFILIGQLLRAKIQFFQKYFVPASLIAGFLGLIIGPRGIGLIPFSQQFGSYSGMLIVLVFASIGIRGFEVSEKGIKADLERIGSYCAYKELCYGLQYAIPVWFSFLVLSKIYSNLHPGFGMLLGAGFVGGHGTAAAIGGTFASKGWADATDLGMTSATIGIITGIFMGIALLKWAAKNHMTSYIKDFGELPQELRTGLIPEEKREIIGKETVSPISIDPLCWHFALLLLPCGLGYIITQVVSTKVQLNIPTFTMGFIVALILYFFLKGTGVYKYVDRNVMGRLGSCFTDYLVFFGVASIRLPVVIKYWVPFSLLMLCGIVIVFLTYVYLAPKMIKDNWVERGIFCFGYLTGVFAIGFALLRIADPDMKSKTLDDTAILGPINTWVDVFNISIGPLILASGKVVTYAALWTGYVVIWYVVARLMKWWYPNLPKARPGPIE
jgi:ESS family glutamate:Na+ symporter